MKWEFEEKDSHSKYVVRGEIFDEGIEDIPELCKQAAKNSYLKHSLTKKILK